MDKENTIAIEIRKWLNDNKAHFPLNIDYWKIMIHDRGEADNNCLSISEEHNFRVDSFYKRFSRLITIKNEQ